MRQDTIAAIATPPGKGGIGIIRLSGTDALSIASRCARQLKTPPTPRMALYGDFVDADHNKVLDQGIAIYFQAPHSFTGEDVVELHGHGGTVVLDMLLQSVLRQGARLANAGEFSQRAYENDKLDLVQAEAIADLIAADSIAAAQSAMLSLQGEFSARIHALVAQLVQLRAYVEAAIDFTDEEIDFLAEGAVVQQVQTCVTNMEDILSTAQQGALLREGLSLVILGQPNAGKSSLLNVLSGQETAIVTDLAGTTRDTLHQSIQIDGLPLHLVDTAGIRDTVELVEQLGIERAWKAVETAHGVLHVVDASVGLQAEDKRIWQQIPSQLPKRLLLNKADQLPTTDLHALIQDCQQQLNMDEMPLAISAKQGQGLTALTQQLKQWVGYQGQNEGVFVARQRHITALNLALSHLQMGLNQLRVAQSSELLAEELRLAQNHLSTITGDVSADDLLGEIFGQFCIGK